MTARYRITLGNLPSRGSAALAVIVAISLLLWQGGMLARLMRTEVETTANFRDGIAAQYLAEAGMRRAFVVLYNSGNPSGLAETLNRGPLTGSYRISTAPEGKALRIRSSSQVGAARRSVSLLVQVSLEPAPGLPATSVTILSWGN